MQENNKLIKLLIPFVAVVVIFESIMLVSNLEKKNQDSITNDANVSTEVATESADIDQEVETPVLDLVFETASEEMKVGKSYKVELNLIGKKDFFIDGIETYVKYDPSLVTISALTSGNKLPKSTIINIDSKNGILKNIVLIDKKEGYPIITDEINQILSFNVVPKKEGSIELEISSGNDDKQFVTMIVETVTSKVLTFSSNKLEINATK